MKRIISAIYFLLFALVAQAQVQFNAQADTNKILIGEQFKVTLKGTIPANTPFEWPQIEKLEKLDLVKLGRLDTILAEGRWELQQELTLSAFDSGYFVFPPQELLLGSSAYESEALAIAVYLPEVAEDQKAFDIKGVADVPINWLRLGLWILLAIALIVGLVFFVRYMLSKSEVAPAVAKPSLPPYEWAVQELARIEGEKLWQAGKIKAYYSAITDVLRQYMERTLAIKAMESTAYEIKEKLASVALDQNLKDRTNALLALSEMVKFAKEKPGEEEHLKSLQTVYAFVDMLKPKPVEA
jgi:hypothetical protein